VSLTGVESATTTDGSGLEDTASGIGPGGTMVSGIMAKAGLSLSSSLEATTVASTTGVVFSTSVGLGLVASDFHWLGTCGFPFFRRRRSRLGHYCWFRG
jgi:hypothetical protein